MDLKEFLSETLVQIVEGIEDAQHRTADKQNVGLNIPVSNPTKELVNFAMVNSSGSHQVQLIQFDIAITATEGTDTKGGIGVVAGVLNLGSSGQSHAENATVSRVKFTLPVLLPTSTPIQ